MYILLQILLLLLIIIGLFIKLYVWPFLYLMKIKLLEFINSKLEYIQTLIKFKFSIQILIDKQLKVAIKAKNVLLLQILTLKGQYVWILHVVKLLIVQLILVMKLVNICMLESNLQITHILNIYMSKVLDLLILWEFLNINWELNIRFFVKDLVQQMLIYICSNPI